MLKKALLKMIRAWNNGVVESARKAGYGCIPSTIPEEFADYAWEFLRDEITAALEREE